MLSGIDLVGILAKHHYKFIEPIGQRCFPTCFRVHSLTYKDDFVVKVIKKKPFFQNEIESLKVLTHPNIVNLYEFFEEEDHGFLILEYCSGGSMEKFIHENKRLSMDKVHEYIMELIDAVEYMHSNKIAHLDIKPENILIDKFGKIKLCDFGLSATFLSGISTSYVGTYNYMSPEMKAKLPYDPFQADVWAVGVTIYFMACGTMPTFVKGENGKLIIPSNLSPQVKELINGALIEDPAERITIQQMQKIMKHGIKKVQTDQKPLGKNAFAASKLSSIARSGIVKRCMFIKKKPVKSSDI